MKSYWLSASAAPRCMLEALAGAVFDFHTRGVAFDAATSGVEWWVHFRGPGEDKKLGGTTAGVDRGGSGGRAARCCAAEVIASKRIFPL